MPTNRKRVARGRIIAGGITEADYAYFTAGDFFEAEGYSDGKTEDELRAFWKAHRTAIMGRYMAENHAKGLTAHRPWAFWKWDATDPRMQTPPGDHSSLRTWDHQRGCFDWVETDYEYLQRLNLLEDSEKITTPVPEPPAV